MKNKISVIGMGYVGCGNALMLAKHNQVCIVDINQKKVDNFNAGKLPIRDNYAQKYFDSNKLNISASSDLESSIIDSSFIIIALPTDFSKKNLEYDTSEIENIIKRILDINNESIIVIKSTVNIGYTERLENKFSSQKIIFSPEFLREGNALSDSLNPSRVIIGGNKKFAKKFADLILQSIENNSVPLLMMNSSEAESVKLFSNTYLAMRVSFFNELDSFCLDNNIDPSEVINGVCFDERIGNHYNNPSFGFGGLCLPKDLQQLSNRVGNSHSNIIQAIQDSNSLRASFLVRKILDLKPKIVGVYKLAMKEGSDNARNSSIYTIIEGLIKNKVKILVYDSAINFIEMQGATFVDDFELFAANSDLIITNRVDKKIKPYSQKVFSRDIFSRD